jgi:hypothetical protein
MKRLKHRVDRKSLECIFFSFIRPVLEYGSIIWDNCDNNDIIAIENVQLEAGRIVSGAIRGTSHNSIYEELGWEPLSKRRERHQILFFHKMVYGQCPQYLADLVPQRRRNLHAYAVRNQNDFFHMRCRTEQYRQSFLPKMIRFWNSLPPETTSIVDYNAFKYKLSENKPKVNQLFYEGDRINNINHARMRMGCSKLNYHLYYNIHVIDSPMCVCGMEEETPEHYLFRCPLHIRSRISMLINILQQTEIDLVDNINVNLLLYGDQNLCQETNKKIYQCVQTYMDETERFNQD